MKNSELKKLLKQVTTNKVVLYALFVVAFINLLSYLQYNCLGGIIVFLFIGLLTSHFTKNMVLILSSAIILTNLLVGMFTLCGMGMNKEGFKEGNKNHKKHKNHKGHKKDKNKNSELGNDSEEESEEESEDPSGDQSENSNIPNADIIPQSSKPVDDRKMEPTKIAKISATGTITPQTSQMQHEEMKIRNIKTDTPKLKTDTPKLKTDTAPPTNPKSGFTNYTLEDEEEMSSNPNSLENVKMMADVQSQLKELVGGNGLQNLDTTELLKQQKDLMKAIKQMQPLIDGATGMMDKLQGFNLPNFGFGNKK